MRSLSGIILIVGIVAGVMLSRDWMDVRADEAAIAAQSRQQTSDPEQPTMSRPLRHPAPTLQALSSETQSLYEYVRPGVVRLQLPPTYWPTQSSDKIIDKWKHRLDPDVIRKLQEEQARAAAGGSAQITARLPPSSTQPATQPSANGDRDDADQNVLIATVPPRLSVVPRPDGGIELGPFSADQAPYDAQVPSLTLNVIGLIIDEKGHVLVPLYIEGGALGSEPLKVRTGDGQKSTATFVGSDRQTNLSVFKLTRPVGHPLRITRGRPTDGSLVMVLSPAGDAGHLSIWTGGQQERGVVVTMDGGVAGFARYGQFLIGAYAQPVVEQLVQHGRVRRATLGVLVEETETPDGRRAMQIERVMPNSVADRAGLLRGDYILSMADTPVGDLPSFAAAIASRDGETKLQILRGEETIEVTVMLRVK